MGKKTTRYTTLDELAFAKQVIVDAHAALGYGVMFMLTPLQPDELSDNEILKKAVKLINKV